MSIQFLRQRNSLWLKISFLLLGLPPVSLLARAAATPAAEEMVPHTAIPGKGAPGPARIDSSPSVLGSGGSMDVRTITYIYDNAGRLTKANYGGDSMIEYSYDPTGNLLSIGGGESRLYLPVVVR